MNSRAVFAVGLVLVLTGCGDAAGGTTAEVVEVERPGGGTVECATLDAGGVDCDWQGASFRGPGRAP